MCFELGSLHLRKSASESDIVTRGGGGVSLGPGLSIEAVTRFGGKGGPVHSLRHLLLNEDSLII